MITMKWSLSRAFPSNGCRTCVSLIIPVSNRDVPLTVVQFQLFRTNLIENTVVSVSYATVDIDPPVYLPYLLSRFLARGGNLIRSSLQHISQVLEGALTPFKPDALVVCAGIGARFLGGVEDKDVYPIRGQTVSIRAPWVRFGRSICGKDKDTYVIPRRNGDVSRTLGNAAYVKCLVYKTGLPWWDKRGG